MKKTNLNGQRDQETDLNEMAMCVRRKAIVVLVLMISMVVYIFLPDIIQKYKEKEASIVFRDVEQQEVKQEEPEDPYRMVKELTGCHDKTLQHQINRRGDFVALTNYVVAEKRFRCHESVTYTTHADFTFLDNLVPVVVRWNGPVSIALYAPGDDFEKTVDSIEYLRRCTVKTVWNFVTFHIVFRSKHLPKRVPRYTEFFNDSHYNCSKTPPYMNAQASKTYRAKKHLTYPINVLRNVAREAAQTHYVLAADIELYPSINIIPKFLDMIASNPKTLQRTNPKVFALNVFEVTEDQQVPMTKSVLLRMINNGTAIPFHLYVCPACHTIPNNKEWMITEETEGLHVFHVGKRMGEFDVWEPFYIGTNEDPLFDERLSWEGMRDKMTQVYVMCILDYDFMILDNAFLVHRPGIKVFYEDEERKEHTQKTNDLVDKEIYKEMSTLYGERTGCNVGP